MPPSSVWFQLLDAANGQPYEGTSATKVHMTSCTDVDDFLNAVKAKHSNKLCSVDAPDLVVYKNKAAFDKRNAHRGKEEPLDTALSLGMLGSKQDILVVVVPSSTSSSLKAFRQKRYKAMSVEASCRKYLNSIASRLSDFYEFDYEYISGPTIGDVLAAKDGIEGRDWRIRKALTTHQQTGDDGRLVEIRKGQPLVSIKLPAIYTPTEWKKIRKLSTIPCERFETAILPLLPNGRPFVVIPHAYFNQATIKFLKKIGVKAWLLSDPDILQVKDEDAFPEDLS